MKILRVLHIISHLKWLFTIWLIGLMLYIFFYKPANSVQLVGSVIFLSGIMMGLSSLSDVTRISKKQMKDLSNPRLIKKQFITFFISVLVLLLISIYFLSQRFIHPEADKSFINDFTKLGYDCLVMILGFLCLIKQLADQVSYVKSLGTNLEPLENIG